MVNTRHYTIPTTIIKQRPLQRPHPPHPHPAPPLPTLNPLRKVSDFFRRERFEFAKLWTHVIERSIVIFSVYVLDICTPLRFGFMLLSPLFVSSATFEKDWGEELLFLMESQNGYPSETTRGMRTRAALSLFLFVVAPFVSHEHNPFSSFCAPAKRNNSDKNPMQRCRTDINKNRLELWHVTAVLMNYGDLLCEREREKLFRLHVNAHQQDFFAFSFFLRPNYLSIFLHQSLHSLIMTCSVFSVLDLIRRKNIATREEKEEWALSWAYSSSTCCCQSYLRWRLNPLNRSNAPAHTHTHTQCFVFVFFRDVVVIDSLKVSDI